MGLKLYNTFGKKMQEFIPIKDGFVGFYGCGPTVYKYAHVGNLRAYVFQDILKRVLKFLGYDVKHIMNVTDIGHLSDDGDEGEDKMIKSAREQGLTVSQIADFYLDAFLKDIDNLNIQRPSIICKATEHVEDMIELIKRIEKNGHTYISEGNLYFDISTFPKYGELSGIDIKTLKPGARIEVDDNKKNPNDFVLWFTKSKFENHALLWDSPWGKGYPGWHVECSAMSMKYLGEQFDIHTGGIDHIRVHHTNEIAQSESATGKKWVNYWLHNEFLVTDKGKMSKSKGEIFTLTDLINQGFSALDYRFFLLGGHYRKQLAFSWDALETAKSARRKILEHVGELLKQLSKEELEACTQREDFKFSDVKNLISNEILILILDNFKSTIEKDLNIPNALPYLHSVIKEKAISPSELIKTIDIMDYIFGLNILQEAKQLFSKKQSPGIVSIPEFEIEELIKLRTQAKIEKDYTKADEIRDKLKISGIILIDSPNGTTWKLVNN